MKDISLTKKANLLFNSGNYSEALSIYNSLSEILGAKIFDANVRMCKEKIFPSKVNSENLPISKYFDHVYVVNLKKQVERKLKASQQLKKQDIDFEVFYAVDGYEGQPKKIYDNYMLKPLGALQRYPEWSEREIKRNAKYIESPGAVGYILTYLNILNDAKIKGYKKFLILEDDIILCKDFHENLKKFISSVGEDWKVLQLGASQYGWGGVDFKKAQKEGYYYPKQLDTCGSFAIAFDHSVVDELIVAESAFEAPFDHLPMGEIYNRHYGKCYVAYPNIVMPDVSESSIRGGRCQYAHGERMKWRVENFIYPYPRPSVALIISSLTNLKYYENFNNHADLNVDLRLYYSSEDGLRPLHNIEMVPTEYKFDCNSSGDKHLPKADFYLTLDENKVLTESDIDEYIEFSLGLRGSNNTPLKSCNVNEINSAQGRVSVIIPTYKRPKNLKNALVSVLAQDYEDLEILVVSDNGKESPFNDEIRALIADLKKLHPSRNIRLIEHAKNRNGAAARNTAIMQSTGEYICFLDDDDIYLLGRISKSVEALKNSKGTDGAVYCGFLGWNSPENDLNRYKSGDLTLEILMLDYKKHYLHTNTATYKREAVLAINGFDESYRRHQDLEFNLRFFELYDIDVVKESGVRLNPEPSDVSNKVFNVDMLKLKSKFLAQFEKTIQQFPHANEIYDKHWVEVIRYVNNKDTAKQFLKSEKINGFLQVSLALHEGN